MAQSIVSVGLVVFEDNYIRSMYVYRIEQYIIVLNDLNQT